MNALSFCLAGAGGFFLLGLLCGAWKYLRIRHSPERRAPLYVDLAHRAALMYAFANVLLARFVEQSRWSDRANLSAAIVLQFFFATSVLGYVVHGALGDTDNQFQRPHRLGTTTIPDAAMTAFMIALIGAEIAAFSVLFVGYLLA
ncbi:MAG TPA: hypothetical protein VHU40_02655 [Polyangia bacterium]|jgi:ABC-type Fe3+ transport system permease subunit|nr:hypothetical protein [Polyangia bacterium]